MIRYRVRCDQSHEWDAWFASSASFDDQVARKLVECPICGSNQAERAVMAPAVQGTRKQKDAEPVAQTTMPMTLSEGPDGLVLPEKVRTFFEGWRKHIAATHDDVGDTFAREARAMHEGDTDPRPIIGTATATEARDLIEDGVPVLPLPKLAVPAKPKTLN
ncbi:MAG: DUF1178 family protein [Hyphomonadaceae bacterium]|jgi:hypothetical protein|nr:DUF1178 family protein [Hyphomonadaceae bacterium]